MQDKSVKAIFVSKSNSNWYYFEIESKNESKYDKQVLIWDPLQTVEVCVT